MEKSFAPGKKTCSSLTFIINFSFLLRTAAAARVDSEKVISKLPFVGISKQAHQTSDDLLCADTEVCQTPFD